MMLTRANKIQLLIHVKKNTDFINSCQKFKLK